MLGLKKTASEIFKLFTSTQNDILPSDKQVDNENYLTSAQEMYYYQQRIHLSQNVPL